MFNQLTQKHDDTELIELFTYFEKILSKSKTDIDWSVTTDFKVFSEFLINDIEEMQERLKNPDDEYLYNTSRHLFNILDWITLMVEDAGLKTFAKAWENLFDEHFGDKNILQNLYDDCFERWISQKRGQYQIGENFYNILAGELYYRDRFGKWFEVDRATAFDLKPKRELARDAAIVEQLNGEYRETWYDALLSQWKNNEYQGVLSEDFLHFRDHETNPDDYFSFSTTQIQALLKNPISIAELERWSGGEIADLEHLLKMAAFVLKIARKRREDDSHTVYLLRDCLMFREAHKAMDIINQVDTSSDQILVGRKLLSLESGDWGYYVVTLDALYNAHLRYPDNFADFYNEYARLMDLFASSNPKFAAIIANLTEYVKEHIRTNKNKIVIFDIGFQGSIALLTKYIIDRHIRPSGPSGQIETEVEIGVGAEWSKKLFGSRHDSDYFPMLNRVQLMTRSDELCHYKLESLNSGKLQVTMGDEKAQQKAAIELAVLVMVVLLTETDK